MADSMDSTMVAAMALAMVESMVDRWACWSVGLMVGLRDGPKEKWSARMLAAGWAAGREYCWVVVTADLLDLKKAAGRG